jgi:hypothetical protein
VTPVSTLASGILTLRDSKPIDDRVTVSVAQTKDLRVTDAASYARAGEHLTGYAALLREIEAYFADDKKRAYALWQSQCKKEKAAASTVEAESKRLRDERQTWKAAQDRLQREAERQAALEAHLREQARLQEEAALLEQQGHHALAEAVIEEAVSAPAPVVVLPSFVPKDLPKRTLYKWRVVNQALVPREFLTLDEKKLTGYANAMKSAARVPGLEFYTEEIDIVRSA